ncbi:Zn-dependent exopeptidase [Aulographum hederae CBS 113979]|uniref:Zn-dependent exopeptidase n=1 Tax=Aulographum hederae CBS 113979 TaxID=1176131 RepID=A0A6G1GN73_9PEZI|nr:Zn-dependent exopeptidase [Aulographum hederae CBS 113979]
MQLPFLLLSLAATCLCRRGPLIVESAQEVLAPRPNELPSSDPDADQNLLSEHHDLLSLHKKLIEIESITGNEYDVGKWLAGYLESHGLTVEKQKVAEKRFNILAYPGKERKTKVLVTSHIDTVPPYWPYQVNHTTSPTTIWGRGSVDAKACVAAQTIAVLNLLSNPPSTTTLSTTSPPSLSLLFVVGEETTGDGMMHFSSSRPHDYPAVVFGEPTEGKLCAGHKGILGFAIHVRGKAAHSGYPWLGLSANNVLVEALSLLLKLENDLPSSKKFGSSTLNIGKMTGGVAANVVAESASASFAIRIAAGEPSVIKSMIQDTLSPLQHAVASRDGELEIEWTQDGYAPVNIDTDIPGFDTVTVNYGTDVPNLKGPGKRYLYGPGSIFVAHSDHEHLEVGELEKAVGDYEKIITEVLAKVDGAGEGKGKAADVVEDFWRSHEDEEESVVADFWKAHEGPEKSVVDDFWKAHETPVVSEFWRAH